jgi:hypothetical protein
MGLTVSGLFMGFSVAGLIRGVVQVAGVTV